MFESLIFVLFLSLLSVVGSAINFRMRLQVAENALRVEHSEKKFRSIFNNSSDGIFQSTLEGDFITANQTLVKMFGYNNLDDLLVTRVTDYYKNKSDREKLLSEVRKQGSVENFITTLLDKNKNEIIAKLNVRRVTDEIPGKEYFEGTIRDVSAEIAAQHLREQAELELKTEKEKS